MLELCASLAPPSGKPSLEMHPLSIGGKARETVLIAPKNGFHYALDRHTGVRTMNLDLDGQPVALAIIEGATFNEDDQGTTALTQVETRRTS